MIAKIEVRRLKDKRRKRRRKQRTMPETPQVTLDSTVETLADAYPLSIYWDNDENSFLVELASFNNTQLHAATWAQAAAAGRIAHILLITQYRANGYTLPEVG